MALVAIVVGAAVEFQSELSLSVLPSPSPPSLSSPWPSLLHVAFTASISQGRVSGRNLIVRPVAKVGDKGGFDAGWRRRQAVRVAGAGVLLLGRVRREWVEEARANVLGERPDRELGGWWC